MQKSVSRLCCWLKGCQEFHGIVGNAQHATITTQRDVIPSVLLDASPNLFTKGKAEPLWIARP